MKKNAGRIMVTGSSGYLGQSVVRALMDRKTDIIAFGREKNKISILYGESENIVCHDRADLQSGKLDLGTVDCIIHCGFAQPHRDIYDRVESLYDTKQLFDRAALKKIPKLINISSTSVYGSKNADPSTEEDLITPNTVYSLSKYCGELMAASIKEFSRSTKVTSIRLSGLHGGQGGLVPIDVASVFVRKALENETIEIVDGRQRIQRLDVRDAGEAIAMLHETNPEGWRPIFNVGPVEPLASCSIVELAEIVSKVAKEGYGIDVGYKVLPGNISLPAGMDSTAFRDFTKWRPKYDLKDTIVSLFEYLIKHR